MSKATLENLVLEWNRGNRNIFNEMYPGLSQLIKWALHMRHIRSSRHDYQDIEQECWIEVMKNLPRWEPARGSLKNFLLACCNHRILKLVYRNQKHEHHEPIVESMETTESGPAFSCSDDELDVEFSPRLRGFRVDYILRRVFVAIFYEVFDMERKKIFEELLEVTRLSKRKLAFLMDYAAVAIRLHLMSRSA